MANVEFRGPRIERAFNQSLEILSTVSAAWALSLMVIYVYDIAGREFFNTPFLGTHEIVGNSIVGILFLELPSSIKRGAMLRTVIVYQAVSDMGRRIIDSISYILGIVLFGIIAFAQWERMITGWEIGEIEGAGAFEVPVYLTRTVIVIFSVICLIVYLQLLYFTITGKVTPKVSAAERGVD